LKPNSYIQLRVLLVLLEDRPDVEDANQPLIILPLWERVGDDLIGVSPPELLEVSSLSDEHIDVLRVIGRRSSGWDEAIDEGEERCWNKSIDWEGDL